jgi:predicted patatin/cPLA2 family phospholipase
MFSLLYLLVLTLSSSIINTCKVLSLSGGGSLGAFEIGVASTLMEKSGGNWDIITGVSAGSINVAYLSTITKGEEKLFIDDYKKLWLSTSNNQVYSSVYFLNGKSLYDTSPLKNTLTKIFKDKRPIRPVLISATSLVKGKSEIFNKTDIQNYGFIDIIMSSTAIPILFPPYGFKNNLYVDGGVTSNILLYEGINYCIKNLPNESISVDVIVCGKKLQDYPDITKKNNIINVAGRLINIVLQQVEYYQILNKIAISKPSINITIYEEKIPLNISMVDFENSEYLWNQGYNFKNVNIYKL